MILLAFAAGASTANRYPDYLPNVRKIAVENNCGGYSHNDGKFAWEYHETPTESIAITQPEIQAFAPKPQHKPRSK